MAKPQRKPEPGKAFVRLYPRRNPLPRVTDTATLTAPVPPPIPIKNPRDGRRLDGDGPKPNMDVVYQNLHYTMPAPKRPFFRELARALLIAAIGIPAYIAVIGLATTYLISLLKWVRVY